jgi:hypothetical protein
MRNGRVPTTGNASGERGTRAAIEAVLTGWRGTPVQVSHLRREESSFATRAPVEVVSVRLDRGERVSLFVKRGGGDEHPDKARPDREVEVYRRLLDNPDLPVARCYGACVEPGAGRHELFLELLDGWDLRYHGLDRWALAVQELARLHSWFASRRDGLSQCDALLRLDVGYFDTWAARAAAAVLARSSELSSHLAPVLAGYDEVSRLLSQQPPTLVHNDLSPKNVVVGRSPDSPRVYLVDWETAGVGCGLLDLVHLTYGLAPEDDRRLRASYFGALEGVAPASGGERQRLLAACDLHKTLFRLAHAGRWEVEPEVMGGWVDDALQFRTFL